ncbi:MAG: hypothetical protein KVP17_005294 [Porospora cf. gigantea B]|uniref:uncharacterized protein n=1 Tax=Porospora cf. gigantea B TaxID=2853592 RepID=UPI003571A123|nr:MAG: hypothetical protein KVP17_005294 [Porospora cf. gigantea B]
MDSGPPPDDTGKATGFTSRWEESRRDEPRRHSPRGGEQSGVQPPYQPDKIHVSRLPPGTTKEQLYEYFRKYGPVKEVAIPVGPGGVNKRYGFVVFESPSSLEDCLLDYKYHTINTKWVEVVRSVSAKKTNEPKPALEGIRSGSFDRVEGPLAGLPSGGLLDRHLATVVLPAPGRRDAILAGVPSSGSATAVLALVLVTLVTFTVTRVSDLDSTVRDLTESILRKTTAYPHDPVKWTWCRSIMTRTSTVGRCLPGRMSTEELRTLHTESAESLEVTGVVVLTSSGNLVSPFLSYIDPSRVTKRAMRNFLLNSGPMHRPPLHGGAQLTWTITALLTRFRIGLTKAPSLART